MAAAERWSDSLCTKRITFISGKPRVAPNCNQFFVFLLQPYSSLTLCLAQPHSIRGPLRFRSFWFRSELIRACTALGRVSFVRSFIRSLAHSFVRPLIRSGWLAGVTPCNRNLHPGSHYLHFNSARLSLPLPPPPPLPNGGYKHKYEFKGVHRLLYTA